MGAFRGIHDRRQLRHADAGDDAGGADRARADADFDRIGALVDQRLGAIGRRDIPGHDLAIVGEPLHRTHGGEHAFGMPVRGVDHQDIDAGFEQGLGAAQAVLADADRGRDAQPALSSLQAFG